MLTPAPVQTAYQQYVNWGQNGMPADMTNFDAATRICEDLLSPLAGIGFGVAVTQGTLHGDRSACLGSLSGRAFIGVTMAAAALPNANVNPAFTDKYGDGDNMPVCFRGALWVIPKASPAVVAGGKVYYDATTGQLSGSSGDVHIPDAMWLTGYAEAVTAPWAPQSGFPSNALVVVRLGGAFTN